MDIVPEREQVRRESQGWKDWNDNIVALAESVMDCPGGAERLIASILAIIRRFDAFAWTNLHLDLAAPQGQKALPGYREPETDDERSRQLGVFRAVRMHQDVLKAAQGALEQARSVGFDPRAPVAEAVRTAYQAGAELVTFEGIGLLDAPENLRANSTLTAAAWARRQLSRKNSGLREVVERDGGRPDDALIDRLISAVMPAWADWQKEGKSSLLSQIATYAKAGERGHDNKIVPLLAEPSDRTSDPLQVLLESEGHYEGKAQSQALRRLATPKQRAVLDLILSGKSVAEAARELHLSPDAVYARLKTLHNRWMRAESHPD
jgi:DNA-binding CsgD family transcriptional regulator